MQGRGPLLGARFATTPHILIASAIEETTLKRSIRVMFLGSHFGLEFRARRDEEERRCIC